MSAEPARKPPWTSPQQPAGGDKQSVLLSSRRTRLSFQRTRMSADRTLMSIVRTSLSLIGFGFTIFQFFRALQDGGVAIKPHAARNFGLTLVVLGVLLLAAGVVGHIRFMLELRRDHKAMVEAAMIPDDRLPLSTPLMTALLLLVIGILAVLSMVLPIGPFH